MRHERTPEVKIKDWVQEVTVVSDITMRSRMVTFLLSACDVGIPAALQIVSDADGHGRMIADGGFHSCILSRYGAPCTRHRTCGNVVSVADMVRFTWRQLSADTAFR
jgi:hypothetical protein